MPPDSRAATEQPVTSEATAPTAPTAPAAVDKLSPKPRQPAGKVAGASLPPYVALILQGGGALGAYHVGAVQALHEAGLPPDWVAGISIGAFNSAIIAGNTKERQVERLTDFWEMISRPDFGTEWLHRANPKLYNQLSYWELIGFGQPRFFTPRYTNPYLAYGTPAAVSYYDTSPMKTTFGLVTDFDVINAGTTRISLGATDIESGELVFFSNQDSVDNQGKSVPKTVLTPEHVIASGSLPPGFPPTIIGDHQYWDGACVSNTPLQAFYNDQPRGRRCIVIVVDLWNAKGPAPQTIDEVTLRSKQIQYATRTDSNIDKLSAKMHLRHLLESPKRNQDGAEATAPPLPEIYHIIYQPDPEQVGSSDVEFSRFSIQERRDAGYRDMKAILPQGGARPMLMAQSPAEGVTVHRMESGGPIRTRTTADVARQTA